MFINESLNIVQQDPNIDHSIDIRVIFRRILDSINPVLNQLIEDIDQGSIDLLEHYYQSSESHEINYDQMGRVFTARYFIKNLWKALLYFQAEPQLIARRMIDAGAGSGAITIAYLAFLDSVLEEEHEIEVVLLDRSQVQLDLAKELLKYVQPTFQRLTIKLHNERIDLNRWEPQEDSADLILLGHILTENRSSISYILEKIVDALSPEGRISIIERTHDGIWEELEKVTSKLGLPCKYGMIRNIKGKGIYNWLDRIQVSQQKSLEVELKYLTIDIPKQKYLMNLLRDYFIAWDTQSVQSLRKVFAQNALYYERPFQRPLNGLGEIMAYWREKVLPQENIQTTIFSVAYERNSVVAEWTAEFVKRRKEKRLKGMLVFETDPIIHRVTELREYFVTSEAL